MSDKKQKDSDTPDVIEGEILDEETAPDRSEPPRRRWLARLIGVGLLLVVLAALYLWARAAGWLPDFAGEEPAPVTVEAPARPANPELARIEAVEEGLVRGEARDADLGERLTEVERRLEEIESAPAGAAAPASEMADGGAAAPSSDLEQRIAALESRLADLAAADASPTQPGAPSAELGSTLASIEARLAAVEAAGRQRADFAARAARVGIAVYDGRPFEAEVIALRDAARGLNAVDQSIAGPHIATLVALGPKGTASPGALSQEFDRLAGEALRAETGAAADQGFWAGVKAKLSELVTIRRRGTAPAQSTEAILDTVAVDLENGDLGAALASAESLEGPAADALAPFTAKLRDTVDARRAVDALIALADSGAGREGGSDSP